MRSRDQVRRVDAVLASLAREEAGLRLRLGQLLEVMGRGKHFELGFSSVGAYALERCDRSVRWVEGARCLARRLETMPMLRRAVAFGIVSWSKGELLARVAQPGDESLWIAAAEGRTVREMRHRVQDALSEKASSRVGSADQRAAVDRAQASDLTEVDDSDDRCTIACTVDREEAWLFEATRTLLEQLGTYGADAQLEALLAEGQESLLRALPPDALDLDAWQVQAAERSRRLEQLSRWRAEAEASCEQHFRGPQKGSELLVQAGGAEAAGGAVAAEAALGLASLENESSRALDARVRSLARSLARHELELSRHILRFQRANGWRQLGYASESQYARERLGLSRSSVLARRGLALRLEKLTGVADALGSGQIGVEAAVQIARVATASTEAEWVERARQRTLKHLREEVGAALVAVRISGEIDCSPPDEAEMEAFHELERAVVSGRAYRGRPANDCRETHAPDAAEREVMCEVPCQGTCEKSEARSVRLPEADSASRRAWLVMLGSLAEWLTGRVQMSAAPENGAVPDVRSRGRIQLKWRVSGETHAWWRGLEAQARRWLPKGLSWLAFLCHSIWDAWGHVLGTNVAYGSVYVRDRYRCSSPVCTRRDVTPHHLRFRSAGGSDEDGNVAAVCTWCHLFGVHGGRIRATGTAGGIRWEFGAEGCLCLVVNGRERMAA